jgi:hypothetical protein
LGRDLTGYFARSRRVARYNHDRFVRADPSCDVEFNLAAIQRSVDLAMIGSRACPLGPDGLTQTDDVTSRLIATDVLSDRDHAIIDQDTEGRRCTLSWHCSAHSDPEIIGCRPGDSADGEQNGK